MNKFWCLDSFERLNGDSVSGVVTQSTFDIMSDMIRSTITSFYERKLGILILYYQVI